MSSDASAQTTRQSLALVSGTLPPAVAIMYFGLSLLSLFLLPFGLAAGGSVSSVSLSAIGADGQAVTTGNQLQAIDISFTTGSSGTSEVYIEVPAGLISVSGTSSLAFTSVNQTTVTYTTTTRTTTFVDGSDDSDNATTQTTTTTPPARRLQARRLAGNCEVTGASITGTTMTLNVEDGANPGSPCPAGSTVSTSITQDSGGSATFNNAPAGTISFTVATNTDTIVVPVALSPDGSGGFTVSVVGDPITWYGGKKIKFWFPNYKLMPMLKTPEMTIWASTFEGPTVDYQWFERFVRHSASLYLVA